MSNDNSTGKPLSPKITRLCKDHPAFCEMIDERRAASAAESFWLKSERADAVRRAAEFTSLLAELDAEIAATVAGLIHPTQENEE